jgi:hypothetical protein
MSSSPSSTLTSLDDSYKPCADLWFKDGTVVLCAEKTLFRIYSGMLAKESAVFGAMFEFPQPAPGGGGGEGDGDGVRGPEAYAEGVPFVRVPDTAYDMTEFLKAIHQPGCVRARAPHTQPPLTHAAAGTPRRPCPRASVPSPRF